MRARGVSRGVAACALFGLFVGSFSLHARADDVPGSTAVRGVSIAVLEDADRALDLDSVGSIPEGRFQPVHAPDLMNRGFSKSVFFLRIRVPETSFANQIRLEIRNPFLDHVDFRSTADPTGLIHEEGCLSRSENVFPTFYLPPGPPQEVWVRVDSRSTYRMPLEVVRRIDWQKSDRLRDFVPTLFLGVGLVLLVLTSLLCVLRRDPVSFAFLAVIVPLTAYRGLRQGLFLGLLKPDHGDLLLPLTLVMADLAIIAVLVWAYVFFRRHSLPSWMVRVGMTLIAFYGLQLAALVLFPFRWNPYFQMSTIVFTLAMVLCGVRMVWSGAPSSWLFLVSGLILPLGPLASVLSTLGFGVPPVVLRSADASVLGQLVVMALAIGHRFRFEKMEYEALLAGQVDERTRELEAEAETRREAQEAAEKAGCAKNAFLATISHELRSPMNVILGVGDLLLESTSLSASDRRAVSLLHQSGRGLLRIIEDVLDASRLEVDRIRLKERGFCLPEWIEDITRPFAASINGSDVDFRLEMEPQLPEFWVGDPDRLAQILMNLLSNAAKFTRKGEVVLSVDSSDAGSDVRELHFRVRDTGIGIPPAHLPLIFDRFSSAGIEAGVEFGGTGLGLYIARSLARLMGGDVTAESEPGKGSRFDVRVRLRVSVPGGQGAAVPLLPDMLPVSVLIAEDQLENRLLFERYLSGRLKQLNFALDGKEAVDLYRSGIYDIVFLDIRMPVKDGLQALAEIRRHESQSQTLNRPILALTAHATDTEVRRIRSAGFTDILTKPVRRVELLQAIQRYTGA